MKRIFFLLLAWIPVAALSQKTTDSTHYTDTVHYHYTYSATGTLNNTNAVKSYIFNNAVRLSRVQKSSAINLAASWVYGREADALTNNDFSSTLDMGLYKTFRHFYYWGLTNYNTSVSLRINHQEQAALGLGYNVIDKKKATLVLSDGPLVERGDLYDILYGTPRGDTVQHDQYTIVRNSFRLLYHWVVHDIFTFDGTGFLQSAFSNTNDYILKYNAGVSVKISKWFSFTTTFTYNKFTRTRSENTFINFGLSITR